MAFAASEFLLMTHGDQPRLLVQDDAHAVTGTALAVLMMFCALWLAFGVRTRVIAALSLALYAGMTLLLPGLDTLSAQSLVGLATVCGLGLPLVLSGGGRYSLARGGWNLTL